MELSYDSRRSNINRTKKLVPAKVPGSKYKDQEFWKRARNVRFHKQSREQNFSGDLNYVDESTQTSVEYQFSNIEVSKQVAVPEMNESQFYKIAQEARTIDCTEDGSWFSAITHKCAADFEFAENVVVELSKCNCCERHKIDRPTMYLPRLSSTMPRAKLLQKCPCNCRMLSRHICTDLYCAIFK
jgi:hypothetical protein